MSPSPELDALCDELSRARWPSPVGLDTPSRLDPTTALLGCGFTAVFLGWAQATRGPLAPPETPE